VIQLTVKALIYPGLGLGTILSQSKVMTDKMIIAGAKRLAELSPALKDPNESLLPAFGGTLTCLHVTSSVSGD
jgi:malic enzyme